MADPITINGTRVDAVYYDDLALQQAGASGRVTAEELNGGYYEVEQSKPIVIPTYKTFRSALLTTSAIQTISRRG